MRIEEEITIRRPPEDVCAVLENPADAPRWMAGLERFEVVAGHPGAVGARAQLHYLTKGRRTVMDDVLIEVDRGRRYLSQVEGEGLTARVEILLEKRDGQTLLEMRWNGSGTRLLTRLFLRFFRRRVEEGIARDLSALKRLVEERHARR